MRQLELPKYLILLFAFLLSSTGAAQCEGTQIAPNTVQFNSEEGDVLILNEFAGYVADPEGKLTIDDFIGSEVELEYYYPEIDSDGHFILDSTKESPIYWIDLTLVDKSKQGNLWYLFLQHSQTIELYVLNKDGSYSLRENGPFINPEKRDFTYKRRYWLRLLLNPNTPQRIIIRTDHVWHNNTPALYIFKSETFFESYRYERLFEGITGGIILIIFLSNLLLFLSTRERTFLYYSAYVLCFGILLFGMNGTLFEVLMPGALYGDIVVFLAASLTLGTYSVFAIAYLDLKELSIRWYRIVASFVVISFVLAIISVSLSEFGFGLTGVRIYMVWTILVFALINVPAVIKTRRGSKESLLFLLGNIVLTLGMIFESLDEFSFTHEDKSMLLSFSLEIGVIIQLIIFSSGIGSRINRMRKEKEEAQEKALEVLEEKVDERTNQLKKQKEVVEEKQQEILDSISYAKRIQKAILPPDNLIKEHLPNAFVLYKPKDIIAGDFYWMEAYENSVLIAAADCTGHGVPGAMVSVVCNNGLNRSVREYGLRDPGEILDRTRDIVISEFAKSEEEVKDGMDIALLSLEATSSEGTSKIKFAGAHNPLWVIRRKDKELQEIKGEKQPIGKFGDHKPFVTHELEVYSGDCIYIFSDGFADQFGGEKGKKFKSKNFKNLLISIQDKSIEEQKTLLEDAFENWRGSIEQLDDVCVIGIKV